jgi:hypothetical protein
MFSNLFNEISVKKTQSLKIYSALFLLLSIFLINCSKDDDDDNGQQTKADQLVGTWQMTAYTVSPVYDYNGTGPITDIYDTWDLCIKDDLYVFESNNEGEFDDGATKCDPGDPQTEMLFWFLEDNGKTLAVSSSYLDGRFSILQLDAATLKLQEKYIEDNVQYTFTTTLTRR